MPISEGRYPLHPDVKSRLALVSEVRDSIEIVHTSEYCNFLSSYFKPFQAILETTQPQDQETAEHKLRNVVLEIFNRLPQNDVLRPYVPDLMQLVLDVLSKDNEENALVCIRIVFDLHKNYRPSLEAQAHNFLEFVCKVAMSPRLSLFHCVLSTRINFFELYISTEAYSLTHNFCLGLCRVQQYLQTFF